MVRNNKVNIMPIIFIPHTAAKRSLRKKIYSEASKKLTVRLCMNFMKLLVFFACLNINITKEREIEKQKKRGGSDIKIV